MLWYICFYSAAAVLSIALCAIVLMSVTVRKKRKSVNSMQVLFAAIFVAALLLMLPAFFVAYGQDLFGPAKSFVYAFQKALLAFATKDVFSVVYDSVDSIPADIRQGYYAVTLAIHFFAPLLTFGFLLSFFKNIYSICKYTLLFWKEVHVFSELNEKTLILGESILDSSYEKQKKQKNIFRFIKARLLEPVIIYTDVIEKKKGERYEQAERARNMGAMLFNKDLTFINFGLPFSRRVIKFYVISDDENEKVRHSAHIIKAYDKPGVSLYLFSDDIRSEKLLASQKIEKMKVLRINDVQSLIYHNLYDHGERLFAHAAKYNEKTVSAVIIGMGRYGTEMFKALTWYCQIPGYGLKINVFDIDKSTLEKLTAACPELMEMNRNTVEGEAHYDITVHSGVDVNTYEFIKRMKEIKDATYVFVGLGDDGRNISAAEKARSIYAGICPEKMPVIETKIYSTDIRKQMESDGNDLTMIGDLQSFYSVDTVLNSRLADMGFEVHLRYADQAALNEDGGMRAELRKFWCSEYSFRSSVAKAMHEDLRVRLTESGLMDAVPGQQKNWKDRTEGERLEIGKVEHVRWNAYMRSEGYVCAPKNHLAKHHHNLVSVFKLSDEDLRKDG